MEYCPKCGAPLRAESAPRAAQEKQEKHEKREKEEKTEKHEKGEAGRFWMLIGGLILVALGGLSLATALFGLPEPYRGALFLVIVGLLIIVFAIYGATRASRRHPRP
jgi:hypothetical protein